MYRMNIRVLIIIVYTALVASCTTMQAIEGSPDQIQQKISSGKFIKTGDYVQITTIDNQVYQFEVVSLTETNIIGDKESVPINLVKRLELIKEEDQLKVGIYIFLFLILLYGATCSPECFF